MVKQNNKNKKYLIGYRAKGITTFKTKIKPLGYVVAALGFGSLAVAVIPNGLGLIFYPLGFGLLSMVGINTINTEKKLKNKLRFALWKFRQ